MAITLVVAVAFTVSLPCGSAGVPRGVFPVIDVMLLVSVVIIDRGRIDRRTREARILNIGLVAILVAKEAKVAGITVRLIVYLARGGPRRKSASSAPPRGFAVWLLIIISFAFYWTFDGVGPEVRADKAKPYRSWAISFPEGVCW